MDFLNKLALAGVAVVMATAGAVGAQSPASRIPDPPRDFRGVWVATVQNIDWPSKRGLSTEEQKQEMIDLLDRTRALNFNAVIFQIRPTMDAMYESELEPWSLYLTGKQGQAPEPFYDPLEFAVAEAHKRGIQLHVWLNPYRAHFKSAGPVENLSPGHVTRAKQGIVRDYGKHYWMDPTDPEALAHNIAVFRDVVTRYDVDGVHMDDYFYPYPEQGEDKKDIEFPDDKNWEAYKASGGTLSRNDWRRSKVNELVKALGQAIKEVRPTVQYGISPFGIWRPGYPEGIVGFDQYDKLFADAKLWLNEGWVDYFTPQLYWRISDLGQSYPYLLRWWLGENTKNRHIWPGLFTSKIGDGPRAYTSDEIINQIVLTRFLGATGNIHFSYKALQRNLDGISDKLTTSTGVYPTPALPPPSPWLDAVAPSKPVNLKVAKFEDGSLGVSWDLGGDPATNPEEKVFQWAVQSFVGGKWVFTTEPGTSTTLRIAPTAKGVLPAKVAIAAVDRLGNISEWSAVETGQASPADESTKERFGQVQ